MNQNIPYHVAIIPDGNRRWARTRGKSIYFGHKQGVTAFETTAWHGFNAGVKHMSIWGMSIDNFTKRSRAEVLSLMSIFNREFRHLAESDDIHQRRVKVNVIGHWQEKLPPVVKKQVQEAINSTSKYHDYFLNIFLLYNGTDEMLQAIQNIINQARKGLVKKVTPKTVKRNLLTRNLPPVDLIIRTGGEPHLSNGFMMWDTTNVELFFSNKLWPEFGKRDFNKALASYKDRRRQHGA